ncbi:hypothetical protein HYH03_010834, partial [Edaphochlamys debaryana]
GGMFGYASCMLELPRRNSVAVTSATCEILVLSKDDAETLQADWPDVFDDPDLDPKLARSRSFCLRDRPIMSLQSLAEHHGRQRVEGLGVMPRMSDRTNVLVGHRDADPLFPPAFTQDEAGRPRPTPGPGSAPLSPIPSITPAPAPPALTGLHSSAGPAGFGTPPGASAGAGGGGGGGSFVSPSGSGTPAFARGSRDSVGSGSARRRGVRVTGLGQRSRRAGSAKTVSFDRTVAWVGEGARAAAGGGVELQPVGRNT